MIQGKNFTVDMENRNLPALYNGGLLSVVNAKKIKKPWFNHKIKSIRWNDFFEIEQNKIRVFRIIPHINVSNRHGRQLWNTLHKSFELYHSVNSRTTIKVTNGLKLTHREKDLIWFDIVFRTNDGNKSVEFYFSTTETMSKKFKMILEQRLNITCEDAELVDLEIPTENTIVNELRYMKHDLFSLDTNHNTQATPIGSILNTVDEMEDGDFARISICNEREDRKRWFNNAVWASKKIKKGKTPQRANISGKRIIDGSKPILFGFINELGSLVNDTLQAASNVFTKESKQLEKKPVIEIEKDMDTSTMKNKDKVNSSTWKTTIRTAVSSPVKFNRDNIMNTLNSSFGEISHDNELQARNIKDTIHIKIGSCEIKIKGRKSEVIRELNTLQMSKKTKFDPNPNIVSSDENGKLIQLPTAELQRKFADCLKTNKKVETQIPSIFHSDGGILIGYSELKGEKIPIHIPVKNPNELYKGYVALGGQGSGKDTFIQNFVKEANDLHNISFVVIDQVNKEGLEGMANGIRDTIRPERIIDLDLSDEEYLPPLDLTEVMDKLGRKGADRFANELIDFFGDLESMGQSRKLLRDFAKASNGSIYNIKKLLENEDFRVFTSKRLREEGNVLLAQEIEKYISEWGENKKGEFVIVKDGQKTLDGKASAILNRIDEFFGDSTLFEIFAQPPKKEMNLEQWMKEGKVIIFRVPDRILSTVAVRTLVHWITLKVLMTRLLMSTEDQSNGTFMVFNESHTYLEGNQGLANLMKRIAVQGRKERLGSIFAAHHLGQLKEIKEDLISGGVHFALFQNDNEDTIKTLANFIKPTFDIDSAMNMPNTKDTRHAICSFNFGGERQTAFMCQTLKPCYKRFEPYNNSFLTLRQSRVYGRSYKDIMELIS